MGAGKWLPTAGSKAAAAPHGTAPLPSGQTEQGHGNRDKAPDIDESMDGRDGYAASRRRITQGWVDSNVRNAVVLTGDVHRNWANDVKVDYKDPHPWCRSQHRKRGLCPHYPTETAWTA